MFKCTGCTRWNSLSLRDTAPSFGGAILAPAPIEESSNAAPHGNFVTPGLLHVIEILSSKLGVMMAEFMCLRAENTSLRFEVLQLPQSVLGRMPSSSFSPPWLASVAASSSAASTSVTTALWQLLCDNCVCHNCGTVVSALAYGRF